METCGCEYEPVYLGPNDEWAGGKITYCPMHAAAPDMLKLLKEIYTWLRKDHGSRNLTYRPAWVEALCDVIERADKQ